MGADTRSVSTLSNGTRTNSVFTAPAGIVNGDGLVCVLQTGGTAAIAPTPPAGWAAITGMGASLSVTRVDPWTMRLYGFYKVASGESGSYTFTHSSGATEGILYCCSGSDVSSPINPATP